MSTIPANNLDMRLPFFKLIIGSLAIQLTLACAQSGRSRLSPTTPVNGAPTASNLSGGSDGSGGITGVSTVDQVRKAHERALVKFTNALRRIELILKSGKTDPRDTRWTPERLELLKEMITGNGRLKSPARQFLASGQIDWHLKPDAACDATDHRHTDGAAKAPRGICISLYTLTRFGYSDLEPKLIQLYAHEFAHLYFGEDEKKPVEIDSLFSELSDIEFPDSEKIKKTLTEIDMGSVPARNLKSVETDEPSISCYLASIYLMYAVVIEFRETFEKPDSAVYFPPQFTADFASARSYMDHLQTDNSTTGPKCLDNPKKFYFADEAPAAIESFRMGVEDWKNFYADILQPEAAIDSQPSLTK